MEEVARKFEKEVSEAELEAYCHLDKENIEFSLDVKFGDIYKELFEKFAEDDPENHCDPLVSQLKESILKEKDILFDADEALMKRQQYFEDIQEKAQDLVHTSNNYLKAAKNTKSGLNCKRIGLIIFLSVFVLLLIAYIVMAVVCKGMAFQGCLNKKK